MNNETRTVPTTEYLPRTYEQIMADNKRSDRADTRTAWMVLLGFLLVVGALNRGCDLFLGPEYRPQADTGDEEADTGFLRGP